jgi:AraC-like DNA-binding protein
MDGADNIERCIDGAALARDEQTLRELLAEVPPAKLVQYLRLLHHWEQAATARKAIALKLLADRLSDKDVARICQLSDRQLRRYSDYQRFAKLLRQEHRLLPRGDKDRDGHLEAWDE